MKRLKRLLLIWLIILQPFLPTPVLAQGDCTLTLTPGLSTPVERNYFYTNDTGNPVLLSTFSAMWTSSAATLTSIEYGYSSPTGYVNRTVYPDAVGSYNYSINDTLVAGGIFNVTLVFSVNPGGVSFSYSCTEIAPTATPTGAYTPSPTATLPPSPTATVTPTSTPVITGTLTTSPTAQPTATPTPTPNPVQMLYNSMPARLPVWTPEPMTATSSISLSIPAVDVGQVSSIALGVYNLLEQWHIFSTLLIVLFAVTFLRWMYAFATQRRAPDPENAIDLNDFIDADFGEIKNAFERAKRRF